MYATLLTDLPLPGLLLIAFGFGVIVGSFLNVVIYRFHTGKSLAGHSHCLSCGTQLQWYELFPLVSYLVLRGRCRTCGCRIPSRYFLVELLTGLAFMAAIIAASGLLELLILWAMLSVLIVITVYDLYHFIIPNELTALVTALVGGLLAVEYCNGQIDLLGVAYSLGAALAGSAFFFTLWFISRGTWLGFGDVKLAIPLGLWVGWQSVFSFVVGAFWIGAAVSLLIIGYQRWVRGKVRYPGTQRALTMKSAVPFAPFLIASSVLVYFTQFNVLHLFSTI